MNALAIVDRSWVELAAIGAMLYGAALVWRGLRGGQEGTRGLLLRNIGMVERIEGFRLMVFGLVLLGVGAALIWRLDWLFYLAIGIGFVEILESSALIAFWRHGVRRESALHR